MINVEILIFGLVGYILFLANNSKKTVTQTTGIPLASAANKVAQTGYSPSQSDITAATASGLIYDTITGIFSNPNGGSVSGGKGGVTTPAVNSLGNGDGMLLSYGNNVGSSNLTQYDYMGNPISSSGNLPIGDLPPDDITMGNSTDFLDSLFEWIIKVLLFLELLF